MSNLRADVITTMPLVLYFLGRKKTILFIRPDIWISNSNGLYSLFPESYDHSVNIISVSNWHYN